jgi:type IV fimbrial biogenesis protein FimT
MDSRRPPSHSTRCAARRKGHRQRGFSLTEFAVTTAIVALTATAVVPWFADAIERRKVEGVAAQFRVDLQFARSQALVRSRSVRVTFPTVASGSCYIVHTGPATGCTCSPEGLPVCSSGSDALRVSFIPTSEHMTVTSRSPSMNFHPWRNTVSPGSTVWIEGKRGHSVQHTVPMVGKAHSCSPQGRMPGLKAC